MTTTEDLVKAARLVISAQFGSVAMLERKMGVGFAHASQLMTGLEEIAVVGPPKGTRARDVLVPPNRLREVIASIRGEK